MILIDDSFALLFYFGVIKIGRPFPREHRRPDSLRIFFMFFLLDGS